MPINRRLVEVAVIPLLVTVIGGLIVYLFSSPEVFANRVGEITTWLRAPVTMPLWQLILILSAVISLCFGYARFQGFRRGGRVKLDGVEWVKMDDVTPTPLCPECGQRAFIVEARGDLRCRIKCSRCDFELPSGYGKAELLGKVEERFARERLPLGDKK